jgi:hypothetical protein
MTLTGYEKVHLKNTEGYTNLQSTTRGARHICFKLGSINVRAEKVLANEKSPNAHIMLTQISLSFHSTTLTVYIQRSPMQSMRKRSLELGVSRSRRKYVKRDMKIKPNRSTSVNELSDDDIDRRYDSRHALWDTYPNCHMRLNDSYQ